MPEEQSATQEHSRVEMIADRGCCLGRQTQVPEILKICMYVKKTSLLHEQPFTGHSNEAAKVNQFWSI
jgi:hypothetical protein